MKAGGGVGFGKSLVCGLTLSPRLSNGMPFANTVRWDALTGALAVHLWPVLHMSPFLDIPGMSVFMDAKNRYDYNLNLLN
jgi:hypothetical protein